MRENDVPTGWWNPDFNEELDGAYDDQDYEESEEIEFDCGFDPDLRRCHHAGSESCQFRCPYHDMFHKQIEVEISF